MGTVKLNLLDLTGFFNTIFKLDEVEPFNDNFDKFGYSTGYFVQNFGTLTLVIVVLPALWIVSAVIYNILVAFKNYKMTCHQKLSNIVFFNGTFVLFDLFYLLLALSAVLGICYLKWDKAGNIVNNLLSLGVAALLVASPFFFAWFFGSRDRYLDIIARDKVFMSKFGEIIKPLAINRRGRLTLVHITFG